MRKTLEDLYYGNLCPWEQKYTKDTEYYKSVRAVSEKEEHLTAQGTVNGITAEENFIMGFRLRMRMGIEAMDDRDGSIQNI